MSLFHSLMEQHHYLKYGEHWKYLAWVQGRPGRLSGLEFGAAPSGQPGPLYRVERGNAANWRLLGLTTGRGKNDQTNKPDRPIKEILGLPLTPRFRDYLSQL